MQSVHRQFGKFMKRTADDSQVSVLLKDFDDADQLLAKIIEASKAWRDAWSSILSYQCRLVNEFDVLYAPIVGSSESPSQHQPAITPQETVDRTQRLNLEYGELRTDLLDEVNMVDERMIKPAIEAREHLQPMKKIIKKRGDKKLDFEKYHNRVETSRKKTKRSDRDNSALAKAELELERAKDEYHAADDHLRTHLPQLISVTFSLLPHLLAAQINIQNTLLAHYYTMLHNYCEQENFPSPPPPMEQIIQVWEDAFGPTQREAETISLISQSRGFRIGRSSEEKGHGLTNGYNHRRPSNQNTVRKPSVSPARYGPPSPVLASKPKLNENPPSSSTLSPPSMRLSPPDNNLHTPASTGTTSTESSTHPMAVGYSPAAPRMDYFSRDRQPSGNSLNTISPSTPSSVAASIAAKKKPPPPPPRPASANRAAFVTALYDFDGQGEGDLVFREGDRIRVVQKTDSTDDWWEGELRGVKGSFPANYCE